MLLFFCPSLLFSQDGCTALHGVAFSGNIQIAKLLLDAGAALEAQTPCGITPLQLALEPGKEASMRFLRTKVNWSRMRVRFAAERLLFWWASRAWAPGKSVERELTVAWESGLSGLGSEATNGDDGRVDGQLL